MKDGTLLTIACCFGLLDVVKVLIKAGANVNFRKRGVSMHVYIYIRVFITN